MKLTDLDAAFVSFDPASEGIFKYGIEFGEAQGVMFECPKCHSHSILCWFLGVPEHIDPKPGRWTATGTGLHDLTLGPRTPGGLRSIQITSGCRWHGYITNGEVQDA